MLWQQLLLAQLVDTLLIHPTISIRAVGRATLLNMHAGLPAAARAAAVQGAAARAAQRRRAVTRMLHPLPRTMTRMLTSKMTKMRKMTSPWLPLTTLRPKKQMAQLTSKLKRIDPLQLLQSRQLCHPQKSAHSCLYIITSMIIVGCSFAVLVIYTLCVPCVPFTGWQRG